MVEIIILFFLCVLVALLVAVIKSSDVAHVKPSFHPFKTLSGGLREVKVKEILDGDTIEVMELEKVIRIRLDAIDCPEDDQPWGDNAKKGLSKLIGGRYVYLEPHGIDKYNRTLATMYVMHDRELINVNEAMVRKGHAWVMPMFCDHLSKIRQHHLRVTERWARANRVGLWKTHDPTPPWLWRRRDSA